MTEIISVRFRGGCKNYSFDPKGLTVKMGDQVIVETAQGLEFATCTQGNHETKDDSKPLSAVVRMATDSDRRTVERNKKRESEAFDVCEKKIADHGLEMKLVNVSASFDGNKIIFYFTADGRVDFRELVRDLASVFRARIELRQIGVRDEAKMIGGLGICGRPFCCSQFLDGFLPVSIKMAKTQNLSLNPTKISGTCGRLMCCLKYEQHAYEDAAKRMPKLESFVQTPDGLGNVKSIDLLRETVKVSLDGSAPSESLKTYRNCEVRVLRNGKGSREGIEVPEDRPARYVEEKTPLEEPTFYQEDSRPMDTVIREKLPESGDNKNRRFKNNRRRPTGGGKPEERPYRQEGRPSKGKPYKSAGGRAVRGPKTNGKPGFQPMGSDRRNGGKPHRNNNPRRRPNGRGDVSQGE